MIIDSIKLKSPPVFAVLFEMACVFDCLASCCCCTATYVVVFLLIAAKVYMKLTTGVYKGKEKLNGKTVIVTGANTGIGKEAAKDFAKRGAKVIIACRDLTKANEAKDDIIKSSGNNNVIVRQLDLASLASVRDFARGIIESEKRIDVLINNAGAGGLAEKITADGLQLGMQINHFGPFLLTNLLVDLMKKSSPSRIIFVSSMAHSHAKLDLDDINFKKSFGAINLYSCSKLANVLNANELARRLADHGVTVNSLHPGAVATEIFRRMPAWALKLTNVMANMFMKSPYEGAQTTIYLAVSEEVRGVTGKYFKDCKEAKMSKTAQDVEIAKKLWQISEDLVKVKRK